MRQFAPFAALLLYAALIGGANPGLAQSVDAAARAEIEALREGDMRKLIVHEIPVAAPATGFTDPDGGAHTLADSDGRVRLVNFWATWCAPCRTEKPSLDALQIELGGPDFEVIAIATGRNDIEAIERFNAEVGVTNLPTRLDARSELARAMNVPGLPVTVVLNRSGQEVARLMGGADWQSDSAKAIVTHLIALDQ